MKLAAFLLFAISGLAQGVGFRAVTFNIGAHLVTPPGSPAYFDYGLGAQGTPDHDTVRDILARLDADVVALQEIHGADITANDVSDLAASLGYPHVFIAPSTNVFDTSLRVAFLSRYPFLTQAAVGSPPMSKELTRLFPAVKVDVPGTTRDPLLIAAHLKSGETDADLFRKAVEMLRLTGHLNSQGFSGAENYIVMGDFNLSSDEKPFTTIPSGMPTLFKLGADISGTVPPITYHTIPLRYFNGAPVALLDPRQLDNSPATYNTGSTLDLLLVSPILAERPMRMEIYNSTLDLSNASGLPKSGSPLAAGTSATASDHYPLVVDLELDPALPYQFTVAGQTVTEDFTAFPGTYDPPPWTRTGGNWKGADDGTKTASGFRAYGSAGDPSLGFLPGASAGTATATFLNQSPETLTALQVSFTAEQWRAHFGGTADSLSAELIVGGIPQPLPQLAFSAANNLASGPIAGGTSAARSVTVSGLAVAPGASFGLRFTFTPGAGGGAAPGAIFINEFHYDNAGGDTGEFIEIVAGPDFQTKLSDIDVLFYNGGNGTVYHTLNLSGPAFTRSTTPNFFDIFVGTPGEAIQNGAPDGIALVNRTTNQVIHFLSYEGSFTATGGVALGTASTDIGVSQTGSEAIGSLALGLTGSGGSRTDFSWAKIAGPYSKGFVNSGQTLVNPVLPSQGIAIDNLAVTYISIGDSDGDGMSDLDESIFGSDPHNAASRYAVTMTRTAVNKLQLSFHRIASNSYVLESSTNLTTWSTLKTYPAGFDSGTEVSVTITPGTPVKFYRVRALAP